MHPVNLQELQIIFQSPKTSIFKLVFNNQEVRALKILKPPFPTKNQLHQFFNEYEILKEIKVPGIRKTFEKTEWKGQPALLLEYLEGVSLKEFIQGKELSLADGLKIAIQLAELVAQIHLHRIIHKDLNPRNIIVNPTTLEIWLIDFEFSTQLDLKSFHLGNPQTIQGTLSYISPEQTGRMNRVVDYRTDLYSLGVSLYELFSSRLPFLHEDSIELVYSHLAKSPIPPHLVTKDIPETLSNLIIKLLSKNAEDRYQSAHGIKLDLEKCLLEWESSGTIPFFPLATQDFSDRFQIPQKLYGREHELDVLLTAYQSISQGNFLLLLVAGYSGVGKSSLVYEVHKPLTENRGYFIEGKFDQYQRDIPYYAWLQAFNQFVNLLLTESPIQLESWKKRLLIALNEEGKVLMDVIPGLEKIIGNQPDVPELEDRENKARFNRVIKEFLKTIAQPEHPLFIFLDDWQWADAVSLELLEQVVHNKENRFLIITGAYRNNEVSTTHPFADFLERSRKNSTFLQEITLETLQLEDVNQMLVDTLHSTISECQDLSEIFHDKTQGNAFFLRQMLQSLYEKQGIKVKLTSQGSKWTWDIEEIRKLKIADNVVDLMVEKIRKLPSATQSVLKLASCIGTLFGPKLLSIVHDHSDAQIQQDLHPALLAGLLLPIGQQFTFAHDRIQQAVYSLIPDEEKALVHYRIGKLLWENSENAEQIQNQLFDVVNQLIEGKACITEKSEKEELAKLCLQAGSKARSASAREAAIRFFKEGISLLEEQHWKTNYSLMMALHFHYADCELTLKRFEEAKTHFDGLLHYAMNPLDKAKIYERLGVHSSAINSFEEGKEFMDSALRICEIEIPSTYKELQAALQIERKEVNRLLKIHSSESLNNLALITDKMKLLTMNSLASQAMIVKILGKDQAFQFYVLKAIRITLQDGFSDATANIFSLFCSIMAMEDRYSESFQFANHALHLIKSNPSLYKSTHTLTRAALWGLIYGKHLREIIPIYEFGLSISEKDEAFMFANIKLDILFHRIAMGAPLNEVLLEIGVVAQLGVEARFVMFSDVGQVESDLILHLKGEPNPDSLFKTSAGFEKLYFPENPFFRGFHSHVELQYYCWFPAEPISIDFLKESKVLHQTMVSNIKWADFDFYAGLFLILRHPELLVDLEGSYRQELQNNRDKLRLRADACPDNFLHKYLLIQAEIARLNKKFWEASNFYQQAIEAAAKYGFTHIHALAHERFAHFFMDQNQQHSAMGHLWEAKRLYHKWGAYAKINQLEEKYPELKELVKSSNSGESSSSSSSSSQALDYQSLLKASQALSGEILLSNLLKKMLPIVMECAGAEEGRIVEFTEGSLRLIARGTIEGPIEILDPLPIENSTELPFSILHYVHRTLEPVVLGEALESETFSKDMYIQELRPRSILCYPLVRNQQLRAIFYFENNLTADAFTADRLEVLQSLSAQISISFENAQLYHQVESALAKQVRLTDAYSRFVPKEFIKHLGHESILDVQLGDQVQGIMSILFADIRSYTTLSEQMTPAENFNFINAYLQRVGPIISQQGGFVGQYYGDGIMAIFMDAPTMAVKAAIQIQQSVQTYNQTRLSKHRTPIKVGIGVHTGPLMMGIIGDEKRMDTGVISDTVNTASRLENLTKFLQSQIIISENTFSYLEPSGELTTRFLGKVSVKGKAKILSIYEVLNPNLNEIDRKKENGKAHFETGLAHYFEKDFINATLELKAASQQFPEDIVAQQYLRQAASFLVEGVPDNWTGVIALDQM